MSKTRPPKPPKNAAAKPPANAASAAADVPEGRESGTPPAPPTAECCCPFCGSTQQNPPYRKEYDATPGQIGDADYAGIQRAWRSCPECGQHRVERHFVPVAALETPPIDAEIERSQTAENPSEAPPPFDPEQTPAEIEQTPATDQAPAGPGAPAADADTSENLRA